MKKVIVTSISFVLMIILNSCADNNNTENKNDTKNISTYTHLKEMGLKGNVRELSISSCKAYRTINNTKTCDTSTIRHGDTYYFNRNGNIDSISNSYDIRTYHYSNKENTGYTITFRNPSKYTNKSTFVKRVWMNDYEYIERLYNLEQEPDTSEFFREDKILLNEDYTIHIRIEGSGRDKYDKLIYTYDKEITTLLYLQNQDDTIASRTIAIEERDEFGNPLKKHLTTLRNDNIPKNGLKIHAYKYYE